MNGPVRRGTLMIIVGLAAIWFATDALTMGVLLRLLKRPVYCADPNWRVTLLPLTVGSDDVVCTPRVLAVVFSSILTVAAASAGRTGEPTFKFTPRPVFPCS